MAAASSSSARTEKDKIPHTRVVTPNEAIPVSLWGVTKKVPFFSKKSFRFYDQFPSAVFRAITGTRCEIICYSVPALLKGPFNVYWSDDEHGEPNRWSVVGPVSEDHILMRIQINPKLGDAFVEDFTDKEGQPHCPKPDDPRFVKWLESKWTFANFKQAGIVNFPLSYLRMRTDDFPRSQIYFGDGNVCVRTTRNIVWPVTEKAISNLEFPRSVVRGRLVQYKKDGGDVSRDDKKIAFVSDPSTESKMVDIASKCKEQGYLGVIFTPNACSGKKDLPKAASPPQPHSSVGSGRGKATTLIPQWRKELQEKEAAAAASLQATSNSSSSKAQSDGPSIPSVTKTQEQLVEEFKNLRAEIPVFRMRVQEKFDRFCFLPDFLLKSYCFQM